MKPYIVLLRGINVGGKNKVPMAELREHMERLGFSHVSTYIASGNVLLKSDKNPKDIQVLIENTLPKEFKLDSALIKVLVLGTAQIQAVVGNKPKGFGEQPNIYHSDVIFMMGIDVAETMAAFHPREGVDILWPGDGVVYSQRLSAERTKSRLNQITISPAYKSMTIRNWNTIVKLFELLRGIE